MLNCKISKVPSAQCNTSVGGVLKMAIANWDSSYSFTASGTDCAIYTIDLGEENFYPLAFAEGTGYAAAKLRAGANNDQKAVLHQAGGVLNWLDCDLISDWKNYLLGRVIVAVLTKNGDTYILGANNGMSATNFDFATGTAETDATGITYLWEGVQRETPMLVKDWATIEALFPAEPEEPATPGNGG